MGLIDLDVRTLLGSGTAGVNELELVVEKINDAIKEISVAEASFVPETFAFGASLTPGSFGDADSAPGLAHHYQRAHEVTWKTLRGVKADLVEFRSACRAAMQEIQAADDQAADNLRVITRALEGVATRGRGRASSEAHHRARQAQDVDPAEGTL